MILLLDNYDSFVYNLYQFLGELGGEVEVYRSDRITIAGIEKLRPSHIVISPGPCGPVEAGISTEVAKHFAGKLPVLGVCLGHQAIGHAFGARVIETGRPVHGKSSLVYHDGKGILHGISNPLSAARYHSLAVQKDGLPQVLKITSYSKEGFIMGLRHTRFTVEGVQFHPESILTQEGKELLYNFLCQNGGERNEFAAGQAG